MNEDAFESKGMRVNLEKTKVMVNGMEEETFDSKIDHCDMCEKELCLTRCYVQHVVSGSTKDARLRRKLQFNSIKILFVRNVKAW